MAHRHNGEVRISSMFFDEIMAQASFFRNVQNAGKGFETGTKIPPNRLPHVSHGWAGDSQSNCTRR